MNKPNKKGTKIKSRIKDDKVKFLLVFKKKCGNVSAACEATGIGRTTYYQWLKDDNNFNNEIENEKESFLDLVESKLYEKVNEGNMAAILFTLRTKGRKRGYIENNQEFIDWEKESQAKLERQQNKNQVVKELIKESRRIFGDLGNKEESGISVVCNHV